jgi:hypothetical protein
MVEVWCRTSGWRSKWSRPWFIGLNLGSILDSRFSILDSRFSILDSRSRPRARSLRGGWLVDFPDMSSGSQTVSAPGSGAAGHSDWLRPPRPSGPPSLVCLCQRTRPPRIQPLSHSATQPFSGCTRGPCTTEPLLHGRLSAPPWSSPLRILFNRIFLSIYPKNRTTTSWNALPDQKMTCPAMS